MEDNYQVTNEFFICITIKKYNVKNVIESDNDDISYLQLDSIKGFKGDVGDEQTKVSASDESVMNIISTVSFLLESKWLKQIKVDLRYEEHENISLVKKWRYND